MTQHLTIPLHEFFLEQIDLRALTYQRIAPADPRTAILRGPYNVPFYLTVEPAIQGVLCQQVTLSMLAIQPRLDRADTSLSLAVRADRIVHIAIPNDEFDALPMDHQARTTALIERLAGLLDRQTPEMHRGTLEEMMVLLQDYASLANREFTLHSALSMQKAPRVTARAGNQTLEIDTVPMAIARWFKPVATEADICHRLRPDIRRSMKVASFEPRPMSGHDRIEAPVRLAAWLTAHYQEVDWTEEDLKRALKEIGAPGAT